MPITYWCVVIAVALAYVPLGFAKFSPGSGYDNARPRQTEAEMTGFRARALGAHHNGLEAFALFAAAVLIAGRLGQTGVRLDQLAIAWVALRVVYIGVYLAGLANLRSIVWSAAMAVALAIMTLPAWG